MAHQAPQHGDGQMADAMNLSGVKVMVIDDSSTIRRSAEIFLKQSGCQVILAEELDHAGDFRRLLRAAGADVVVGGADRLGRPRHLEAAPARIADRFRCAIASLRHSPTWREPARRLA